MALDQPIIEKKFYIDPKEAKILLKENYKVTNSNAQAKLQSEFRQQNRDLISDYNRYTACFKLDGASVNAVKETLRINQKLLTTTAVAGSKNRALEISADKMIEQIQSEMPNIHMPRFIIGLPNYRGHCYFNPIFVPLFNNRFFVQALREAFDVTSEYLYKTGELRPESYRNQTISGSCPFLFVRIIKQFYNKYRKASLEAELNILNWPTLEVPRASNTNDLIVDRALMKIVIELANKEDPTYKTPGGVCQQLFTDIVSKITSDFELIPMVSPFHELFNIQIDFEYTCLRCDNFGLRRRFESPYINVPARHKKHKSLQEFLENLDDLLYYQDSQCKHFTFYDGESLKCEGSMLNIRQINLNQAPPILVFHIYPGDQRKAGALEIPDTIKLPYKGQVKIYEKFAYSLNYPIFKRQNRVKSIRFTDMEPGDMFLNYHAVTMIKSQEGWFEVNNSNIYEPVYFSKIARIWEVVYYQMVIGETDCFLPKVGNYFTNNGEKKTVS